MKYININITYNKNTFFFYKKMNRICKERSKTAITVNLEPNAQ